MKTIPFRDGDAMPALGLGTWLSNKGEVGRAVKEAVRVGYRHFDCAAIYGNEAEIGDALAECIRGGLVTREALWITSKLWNDAHAPEDVPGALARTLRDLQLEYLDLYLVHWPVAVKKDASYPLRVDALLSLDERPLAETWAALEDAVDAGACRHIGVSNFSARKLAALHAGARVKPESNQVELHPYLQQRELLATCARLGVSLTAYAPLGARARPDIFRERDTPVLLDDPTLAEIAARHDATPAQVAIAWALQRGTAVIPKSTHPGRIAQNFAAAAIELSAADMQAIAALDRHLRLLSGAVWAVEGGPYTLASLWDE